MESELEKFTQNVKNALSELTEEEAIWFLEILEKKMQEVGGLWQKK